MHVQSVADAFELGRAISLSDPVARGELGEIRRLDTDQGAFAVKQTLESWSIDEAEISSAYHRRCWEAGIPTPEPIRATTGGFTAHAGGKWVRAYRWVGLADPDPTLDPAAVGTLVARLHQVRYPWPRSEIDPWFEAPIGRAEWEGVLEASRAAGAPYADRLAELLPGLLEIEAILTPMRAVQTCHLDLWADNLRESEGRPLVIDFDNAGPGDPSREIAMVIFEFGRRDAARQLFRVEHREDFDPRYLFRRHHGPYRSCSDSIAPLCAAGSARFEPKGMARRVSLHRRQDSYLAQAGRRRIETRRDLDRKSVRKVRAGIGGTHSGDVSGPLEVIAVGIGGYREHAA